MDDTSRRCGQNPRSWYLIILSWKLRFWITGKHSCAWNDFNNSPSAMRPARVDPKFSYRCFGWKFCRQSLPTNSKIPPGPNSEASWSTKSSDKNWDILYWHPDCGWHFFSDSKLDNPLIHEVGIYTTFQDWLLVNLDISVGDSIISCLFCTDIDWRLASSI